MKNSQRDHPRLSINELAEYMVATDRRRSTILRDAKFPKSFITTQYREARLAICKYLFDPIRSISILSDTETKLHQIITDTSSSSYLIDRAQRQIQCLKAVQAIQSLPQYSFIRPTNDRKTIDINGVGVSVQLDLIVVSPRDDKYGGAILRLTKDDTRSDVSKQRREEMGTLVAVLIHMLMKREPFYEGTLHYPLCLSH